MAINLQTVKCSECGSGAVRRVAHSQYVCGHCGSPALAEELGEQLHRCQERVVRRRAWTTVAGIVLITAFVGFNALLAQHTGGSANSAISVLMGRQLLDTAGLRLDTPRNVGIGSGTSAPPKLLVVARNETPQPLERPEPVATFFDGTDKLESRKGDTLLSVLLRGESMPMLFDVPATGARPTSAQAEVSALRVASPVRDGPPATLVDARRLDASTGDLRFLARPVNDDLSATMDRTEIIVVLHDGTGQVTAPGGA